VLCATLHTSLGQKESAYCHFPRSGEDTAAPGLDHFDDLLELAAKRAPAKSLVSIEDVGMATAVLATDYAKLITGETVYVDGIPYSRVTLCSRRGAGGR
jgi:NAD(P)-dependent dehydrogenase (short-subunit alcohol dehydrogenase family)